MTVADAYRKAFEAVVKNHPDKFKELITRLEKAAEELGLSQEFKKIFETSTNISKSLREFALKHPEFAEKYKKIFKETVEPILATELSKAYSEAWDDKDVDEMRKAAEKIKKAYSLLLNGDYEGAAATAGIDVNRIKGLPVRDAMKIIAQETVSSDYSKIIGKASGRKVNVKAIVLSQP